MEYLIGLALSLLVAGTATSVGFDRERAYYPVLLIVIASYYVLFASMGAPGRVVILESLVAAVFSLAAVIGFKGSLWTVVAARVAHGVFDLFHHRVLTTRECPSGGPAFVSHSMLWLAAFWRFSC